MCVSRTAGILLVILGCAVNKWTLEATVVPDGRIESVSIEWAIAIVQLSLMALGAGLFIRAPRFRMPTSSEWVLLVTSVLIGLGLVEVLWRFVGSGIQPMPLYVGQYKNRSSRNFVEDAQTGWRMRANHEFQWIIDSHSNTYRSNRQGFRSDRDFDASHGLLIGLAGDSFTYGTGVDYSETFGDLVERELAGGDVYNFAQPGFGIDQMWMSVRHQILPLMPDLIVVAFIDDDFTRSLNAYRTVEGFNKPRFLLDSGRIRPQTVDDVPNRLVLFLQVHSRLWQAFTSISTALREEYWDLNTAILKAIEADCKHEGVSVLFIRLPEQPRRFDALDRWFDDYGLEFIDLGTPAVPADIHFKTDGHINAKGHRFVASAIINWLRARQSNLLRRPQRYSR